MENKINYIRHLKSLISVSKHQIVSVMNLLGFTPTYDHGQVSNFLDPSLVDCQETNGCFDLNKIISDLKDHLSKSETCGSGTSGPLLPSFHSNEKLTCIIDDETRAKLLEFIRGNNALPSPAVTADEYSANYSSIEKNVLYQYALTNTTNIQTPPELSLPEESETKPTIDEKNLTEEQRRAIKLESLKKERDLKRRRIAYRKKVSTKNKSPTEVTREMISNLMEALFGEKMENTSEDHSVAGSSSEVMHSTVDRKSEIKSFDRRTSPWPRHSHNYHRKEYISRNERQQRFSSDRGFNEEHHHNRDKSRSSLRNSSDHRYASEKHRNRMDVRHRYEDSGNWQKDRHRDLANDRARDRERRMEDKYREKEYKDKHRNRVKDNDGHKNKDTERIRRMSMDSEDLSFGYKKRKFYEYKSNNNDSYEAKESYDTKDDHRRKSKIIDDDSSFSEEEIKKKKHKHKKKKKKRSLERS